MPKGIPGSTTKDDLRARIKEIEARIKQMDRREKSLGDLKGWLANRKLDHNDLHWMMRQMRPKRAAKAVVSKKPLQPVKSNGANGTFVHDGKSLQAKGDPEFRRRVREARKAQKLSSTQIGKKLGISASTVTAWESGRYIPGESNRAKLVKFLGLPAHLGEAASHEMEAAYPGVGGNSKGG